MKKFQLLLALLVFLVMAVPVFAQDVPSGTHQLFLPSLTRETAEPVYPAMVVVNQRTEVYNSYFDWLTFGPPYELPAGSSLYVYGGVLVGGYTVAYTQGGKKLYTPYRTW